MNRRLKISVVIASYNRSMTIPSTLRCLAEQTLHPSDYEVIVVDDGSPDDTEGAVRSAMERHPYDLRYLRHANRGICYTQNRGIRHARAPLILLIPDDIKLVPGALAAHVDRHERHPDPHIAILGKVLQSDELATESVFLRNWDPFKFKTLKHIHELPYYYFWAFNISFKKDFVIKNGMFNESLVRGGADGHEDVELGYRLARKGLRILYSNKALGYHYHIVTLKDALRKYYHKGQTWPKFRRSANHPEITVHYHVLSIHTLKDYMRTFRHPNRLLGVDRNPVLLLFRHVAHALFFNFMSVPFLWLPLMFRAEKFPQLAKLMHPQLYRGVLFHFFLKGAVHNLRGFCRTQLYGIKTG